ncbi:MAG: phospholipase A [Acinetobacter sp.]
MLFKSVEPRVLAICILAIMSGSACVTAFAAENETIHPTSATACTSILSNADRLACYDAYFKSSNEAASKIDVPAPASVATLPRLERTVASDQSVTPKSEQEVNTDKSLKSKLSKSLHFVFSSDTDALNPNDSLLDSRWELSENSKLGTWNIRAYKPVYALPVFWTSDRNELPSSPNPVNTVTQRQDYNSTESKFQLSLKTKAWENIFGNNGDLWLAYTQSSRWQTYNEAESRPFRETNYEPEASLIFRTNYNLLGLNGRLLGLTFNHQSNGKSDPFSRSWNRVMLNIGLERGNFALMLRPWYRLPESAEDDNNPDIENYVGRGDLTAFYKWRENNFSLMLRHSLKGGDDSHGAVQFDWTFPIKGKLRGQVQYFNGYGESLIDYNHRANYIGIGISLMDWF